MRADDVEAAVKTNTCKQSVCECGCVLCALSTKTLLLLFLLNNYHKYQRWSSRGRLWPRGHILKFLALASKVKSLASKPQVLKNSPVFGLRTALFFEPLKLCWKMPETSRKIYEDLFCIPFLEIT